MPKAPTTPTTPRKRMIDWKKYGARSTEEGDRIKWGPNNVDDTIAGVLARVDEVNTRFGSKVVMELDAARDVIMAGNTGADGDYVAWPTPGLINALEDAEADQGDFIVITLTELIDTNKGNPYKVFEVRVVPETEPF